MSKFFGTDGIRGMANKNITCDLAFRVAQATVLMIKSENKNIARPNILIGKDTRISSDMLECALSAGFCSMGADVNILGVVPTPCVAYLTKKYNAVAGVMISASHNSYEFNGIKIFNSDGCKLSEELELKIEDFLSKDLDDVKLAINDEIGKINYVYDLVDDYVEHIRSTSYTNFSKPFRNFNVAFDCSNGSSSKIVEKLFSNLGINCHIINNHPNGININQNCGSTHINSLINYVLEHNMDCGFAFDGDADRCLAIDNNGRIFDGDRILSLCAKYMKSKNKLKNNSVVGTIMSNMGFENYCIENDMKFIRTKVGDKYVLHEMLKNGYNLGGEQSGHIIFLDYASTGDGLLTAFQILNILSEQNSKLSENYHYNNYEQLCENIKFDNKTVNINEFLNDISCEFNKSLEGHGRIVIRKSGTEPVIRVMVECIDCQKGEIVLEQVKNKILQYLAK